MMNVLVLDSSVDIIERIKELLLEQENINEVYGVTTYEEAKECFNSKNPEILVLDSSYSCNKSYDLIREVKESNPYVIIIAISIYADDLSVRRVKESGANFFLDKYLFSENISSTLEHIMKNVTKLNPILKMI